MRKPVFVSLVLVAAVGSSWAYLDTPKKPIGTWTRTVGDNSLTFEFKESTMLVKVQLGTNKVDVEADYAQAKDGTLFFSISKVTKTGTDGGPSEGELFSFGYSVDGEKMTINDWKGHKENPEAKGLVEGEYKKKSS